MLPLAELLGLESEPAGVLVQDSVAIVREEEPAVLTPHHLAIDGGILKVVDLATA
jgi:hypothetical protein